MTSQGNAVKWMRVREALGEKAGPSYPYWILSVSKPESVQRGLCSGLVQVSRLRSPPLTTPS